MEDPGFKMSFKCGEQFKDAVVLSKTDTKICKSHFRIEKMGFKWCLFGNETVYPFIFFCATY